MAEHNIQVDPELHESKGASLATVGTIPTADGAGSTSWDSWTPGADSVIATTMKTSDASTYSCISLIQIVGGDRSVGYKDVITILLESTNGTSIELYGIWTASDANSSFRIKTNIQTSAAYNVSAGLTRTAVGPSLILTNTDTILTLQIDSNSTTGRATAQNIYYRITA